MPEIEAHPDEVGVETEEDASAPSNDEIRQAFVTGSDWTTETIISQLRKGNINLNPIFQRREVWTRARKSLLIESIILNLPVPQIVLAERKDQPNTYIVLDGKQRGNVNPDWPHRARLIWPRLFGVVWWSGAGRTLCRFR